MRWTSGEIFGRLLLLVGGLLAGLVVLEAALQTVAAVRRWREGDVRSAWRGGATRVLAVGDSNTYGLYVGGEQAYPAMFEAAWNVPGRAPVDVISIAFPGMSSRGALAAVDEALPRLRPDVVLVMIGVNDVWTLRDGDARSHSRVAAWLSMSWAMLTAGTGTPFEIDYHGPGFPIAHWAPSLASHLRRIVADVQAAGATIVLLTYPADDGPYRPINRQIRVVARELGVPLVDLGLALRRTCPAGPTASQKWSGVHERCDLLFADGHPTAKGHVTAGRALALGYGLLGGKNGQRRKTPRTAVPPRGPERAAGAVPSR